MAFAMIKPNLPFVGPFSGGCEIFFLKKGENVDIKQSFIFKVSN